VSEGWHRSTAHTARHVVKAERVEPRDTPPQSSRRQAAPLQAATDAEGRASMERILARLDASESGEEAARQALRKERWQKTNAQEAEAKRVREKATAASMVLEEAGFQLYIAGLKEAAPDKLKLLPFYPLGFTHVLHCQTSRDARTPYSSEEAQLVHVGDMPDHDLRQHFPEVLAFMKHAEASSEPTRLLVHCKQGVSRSATCVLAYLMCCRGMPLREACAMLKQQRPQAQVNQGFARQLIDYERELFPGKGSVSFEEMQQRGWTSRSWVRPEGSRHFNS